MPVLDFTHELYERGVLDSFRTCETLATKYSKCHYRVYFVRECLSLGLTPKFCELPCASGSEPNELTTESVLVRELKDAKSKLKVLHSEFYDELISCIDKLTDQSIVYLKNIFYRENCNSKKLENLFVAKYKNAHPAFTNLSSLQLSPMENCVLSLGPKFVFRNKHKESDICTLFEIASEKISRTVDPACLPMLNSILSAEKHMCVRENNNNYPSAMISKLMKHINESGAILLRTDKESKLVLLDRTDYVEKMRSVLDGTQFAKYHVPSTRRPGRPTKLPKNAFEVRQSEVDKFVENVPYLSDHVVNAPVCRQPFLYGLVKTHKPGNKLRPILSATDGYNYSLAKFLAKGISKFCYSDYCVQSTDELFGSLCCDKPDPNHILASFDVESLFTNVPVQTTIDLLLDKIYSENDVFTIENVSFRRPQLHRALYLACTDQLFNFDGEMYVQKDGVAMGSPLGMYLANFYVSYLEKCKIDFDSEFAPVKYNRYVDDTLLIFKSAEHIPLFLEHMNSLSTLHFTCETATNNSLNFIGITIKNAPVFGTSVYRKFDYNITSAYSNVPESVKYSGFSCLVSRILKYTSSWRNVESDVHELKMFAYSMKLNRKRVDEIVQNRVLCLYSPKVENTDKCFVKLPFINQRRSKSIQRDLNPYKIVPVFVSTKSLYASLRVREVQVSSSLGASNCVYKYNCGQCDSTYVGQTSRLLSTRISEHSRITSELSKCHLKTCDSAVVSKDFSVIEKCTSTSERTIKECFYIKRLAPDLNSQVPGGQPSRKRIRLM